MTILPGRRYTRAMADEKDRLGEKLRDKEKAEEDRYFAERDKAMLEKLRQRMNEKEMQELRTLVEGHCPKCATRLVAAEERGVAFERCPTCQGVWLDKGEMETLAKRERDSWLGRYFFGQKV